MSTDLTNKRCSQFWNPNFPIVKIENLMKSFVTHNAPHIIFSRTWLQFLMCMIHAGRNWTNPIIVHSTLITFQCDCWGYKRTNHYYSKQHCWRHYYPQTKTSQTTSNKKRYFFICLNNNKKILYSNLKQSRNQHSFFFFEMGKWKSF